MKLNCFHAHTWCALRSSISRYLDMNLTSMTPDSADSGCIQIQACNVLDDSNSNSTPIYSNNLTHFPKLFRHAFCFSPCKTEMCNSGDLFKCTNGSSMGICISISLKCNQKRDCYDGDDETGCRKFFFLLLKGRYSVGHCLFDTSPAHTVFSIQTHTTEKAQSKHVLG